MKYISS